MKITNAIKKLEKAGFKIEKVDIHYRAVKQDCRELIEFYKNGREDSVTCIRVRRKGDLDDVMTDYFAGFFVDNITQAIKAVSI